MERDRAANRGVLLLTAMLLLGAVIAASSCGRATRTGEGDPTDVGMGNRVDVTLNDFDIDMPLSLPAGPTTFEIVNRGNVEHSFELVGEGIERELYSRLDPGEQTTLEVELRPGSYRVYCPVGNHAEQGMSKVITVQ